MNLVSWLAGVWSLFIFSRENLSNVLDSFGSVVVVVEEKFDNVLRGIVDYFV